MNDDTRVNNDEHTRTGLSLEALKRAFLDNLFYIQARFPDVATEHDRYMAAAYTVRERMLERWIKTAKTYKENEARTVCYLSAEFLLGPHLNNNLINLDIADKVEVAAKDLDLDLEAIFEQEVEPGLGNGGLGRLAACYLDSLATLQIPAIGYGIRYEFGIFDQVIEHGWQVEKSDLWLRNGNPWEIIRPKLRFSVGFGGHTELFADKHNQTRSRWVPELVVNGVAYDTPILGYQVDNTNLLRLWSAEATASFDFDSFNKGDYYGAINEKVIAENISKVLYPNDEPEAGKELRLRQQYFFVSCSLQDMIRLHLRHKANLDNFHHKFAAQLNDTHPAIAVAELMRLLIDIYGYSWKSAWHITRNTFAYTNHTLLPEALETWSVKLLNKLLPRHLEIIYEINGHFLDEMRTRYPFDHARIARLSIIAEEGERRVRMANLATVGSFAVNGVAALHTELLKTTVMKDFYEIWPDKFHNVTNGVTPRRFVRMSNTGLNEILCDLAGPDWAKNLSCLEVLEKYADDTSFHSHWQSMKLTAKQRLSKIIKKQTGISVDPNSMFDIQVKRIHEYKRQHLNALHIVTLYHQLKKNPEMDISPRTFVFGGKAAPGYFMAKLIIKFITSIGAVINNDPQIKDKLKIVFLPDFNVKHAQPIYPAADISEQISLAGKEASGTGNMKFSMNGALTIGTLDGANVEIRDEVGHENFFLFGMTVDDVKRKLNDGYRPQDVVDQNATLSETIDLINSGIFSHGDLKLFRPLVDSLVYQDPYLVLADYQSYVECQQQVDSAYKDTEHWNRMSILNVARMGKFSSDRSIRDYCKNIWKVEPTPVSL